LLAEGNVILRSNNGDSDDDEREDVVFEVTAPTVDKSGNDEDKSEGEESVVTMSFGEAVLEHWTRCKTKIEHQSAIAAWVLCVMEDVCKDVKLRLKGVEGNAIEEVVIHLHLPPCPNKRVNLSDMSSADIVDTFWNEFKAFVRISFMDISMVVTYYLSS
jgi:hypothetical protein